MKKTFLFTWGALLYAVTALSQAPSAINYQAALRNNLGAPMASTLVQVRFTIHNATATGIIVFQETNAVTTTAQGLMNTTIGTGAAVTGALSSVDWSGGPKFLEVEVNTGSGFVSIGTQQMVSVPYALQAGNVPFTISGTNIYNNNTGNVGINTSNPSNIARLHVDGAGSGGSSGSFPYYNTGIMVTSNPAGSTEANGIYGEGTYTGMFGRNKGTLNRNFAYGVLGLLDSATNYVLGIGVAGSSRAFGNANSANYGLWGYARNGAQANYSIYGEAGSNASTDYAGYFSGKTYATNFSASVKAFRIDHPQDPVNKYLVHSSVESNDMMNIYNGNVTTDAAGEATVQLPGYFCVLNKDFKYQLTCIGQFAQAIVLEEIHDNLFRVKTDKPNVKVSWLVAGVRQDAAANYYRIVDEIEKPASEKGYYLVPEAYGLPPEMNAAHRFLPGMNNAPQE